MTNYLSAVGFTVLSMLCFSATYAFYKACGPYLSSAHILCIVNFISWLLILPFALKYGLKTQKFPAIFLRTFFGIASLYSISLALTKISFSETVLLNNTAPLFVPLIVWFWHRFKIPTLLWVSLFIGFIGVIVIIRPGMERFNSGFFIGLFSGVAAAAMLVVSRQIANERFLKILFYYFLIFWLALFPFIFVNWTSPPAYIWLHLISAGITMIFAQLTLVFALRRSHSHAVAPFIYTSVIFAGLLDWIFWHHTPSLTTILGMVIVIIGGFLAILTPIEELP